MSLTSVPLPGTSSSAVNGFDPASTGAALVTVMVSDCGNASTPPPAVPPSSRTVKAKVPVPSARDWNVMPCSCATV
ncbi:hypothetical protein ACPWT1_11735 [Ramlibacter sp. MMS24-I3-19]|uniref:hypothetical protein n=1 Tax=Ramlibacter sp. MMS24-I3-19 TaxID=3416606 RepID=UPI003CFBD10E